MSIYTRSGGVSAQNSEGYDDNRMLAADAEEFSSPVRESGRIRAVAPSPVLDAEEIFRLAGWSTPAPITRSAADIRLALLRSPPTLDPTITASGRNSSLQADYADVENRERDRKMNLARADVNKAAMLTERLALSANSAFARTSVRKTSPKTSGTLSADLEGGVANSDNSSSPPCSSSSGSESFGALEAVEEKEIKPRLSAEPSLSAFKGGSGASAAAASSEVSGGTITDFASDGGGGGLLSSVPKSLAEIYEISNRNRKRNKERKRHRDVPGGATGGASVSASGGSIGGGTGAGGSGTFATGFSIGSVCSSFDAVDTLACSTESLDAEEFAGTHDDSLLRNKSRSRGSNDDMGSVLFNESLYFQPRNSIAGGSSGGASATGALDNSASGTLRFAQEIGWVTDAQKVGNF